MPRGPGRRLRPLRRAKRAKPRISMRWNQYLFMKQYIGTITLEISTSYAPALEVDSANSFGYKRARSRLPRADPNTRYYATHRSGQWTSES